MQSRAGRADGQPEQQALAMTTLVLRHQPTAKLSAQRVQQDRILAGLLREDPLGQPRQKDDVEAAPPRLLDGADEDAPVPVVRRPLGDRPQLVRQHVAHLGERHRSDHVERPQRGEDGQHPLRAPQHDRRERLQRGDPLAPRAAARGAR